MLEHLRARGRRQDRDQLVVIDPRSEEDLPCPWCQGPTAESDPRCRTCGRRFG